MDKFKKLVKRASDMGVTVTRERINGRQFMYFVDKDSRDLFSMKQVHDYLDEIQLVDLPDGY